MSKKKNIVFRIGILLIFALSMILESSTIYGSGLQQEEQLEKNNGSIEIVDQRTENINGKEVTLFKYEQKHILGEDEIRAQAWDIVFTEEEVIKLIESDIWSVGLKQSEARVLNQYDEAIEAYIALRGGMIGITENLDGYEWRISISGEEPFGFVGNIPIKAYVVGAPKPTVLPTPMPTNTPIPTATPTDTPTPTATPTNTPTPTATAMPVVPTNTPMPTATSTPTNTPIPTVAPTNTPTPTATSTPMATPTNTPIPTSTPTIKPTIEPTLTPVLPVPTQAATPTAEPTLTPVPPVPTQTATPTAEPKVTPTATPATIATPAAGPTAQTEMPPSNSGGVSRLIRGTPTPAPTQVLPTDITPEPIVEEELEDQLVEEASERPFEEEPIIIEESNEEELQVTIQEKSTSPPIRRVVTTGTAGAGLTLLVLSIIKDIRTMLWCKKI